MNRITEKKISTKYHKNYRVMIEEYSSAVEVYEDCKTRKITDDSFHDMAHKDLGKWEGVKDYEEALTLLRNGYQPTVEKLKEQIRFNKAGAGKRISFQNNIVGYAPVVPLAMMNVPNCMVDMKMKPIKCKVLDIYYDMTCSSGTSSKQIIENGQKLLGTIIELEKQGYKFNLYAMQTYSNDKSADMLLIKIKSSNQPLDLKRISFPLTHTAFFRVIGFDWYSKTPKGVYRSAYGHALAHEFGKTELKEFATQALGKNAIYISGTEIMQKDEEHIKEVLLENERNSKN